MAIIDGVISRIGLAALLGFALKLDCFGFWMGDTLAGFMPMVIGSVFYFRHFANAPDIEPAQET